MKRKDIVILGLSFLTAGFWCNLIALQAFIYNSPLLKIFGDVLPFEFSIGDCFVFCGYGIFTILLADFIGYTISKLILQWRR